jgi:acyl-CoA synthetase (NDP forming)
MDLHTDLRSVPGAVDSVIVAVPKEALPQVLDDCAAKGVKAVQLFTAGFRESGTETGLRMEKEIADRARQGGFRLIGPNCIGVHNPSVKVPYGPLTVIGEPGSVGFISQSGGHGGRFVETGLERGIRLSKVVSFGNGADLDETDFLEYMAADHETKIIGAYLESLNRPARFLELVSQASRTKPVIVWKGGRTGAGAETAASHTGALASSYAAWRAAMVQTGAIAVESLEEMADAIMALEGIGRTACRRVAIISGMGSGGGGESVLGADACSEHGLEVPRFGAETRRQLASLLPPAGAILRNPIDFGGILPGREILEKMMGLIFDDRSVDLVIVQQPLNRLLRSVPAERIRELNEVLVKSSKAYHKPLVVVAPAWAPSPPALEIEKGLRTAGVPVYRSFEAAARSMGRISDYFEGRRGR